MREAIVERKTAETDIKLRLNLDVFDGVEIDTGAGFLDHMLTLFAYHGRFGLSLKCTGDTHVDAHHTTEDAGLCLGGAFYKALGTRAGITRYGDIILPMDEALVLASVDISGRAYLGYDVGGLAEKAGDFDTELVKEFWLAFTRNAGITLHFRKLAGENTHHIIEACFKAAGRVLGAAAATDPRADGAPPSTKGTLL